jgi:hypothetical protein
MRDESGPDVRDRFAQPVARTTRNLGIASARIEFHAAQERDGGVEAVVS